ncbi:ATPase P-type K/Mg/Cd/Cu/Zn/Na/Ca/Na/H-transporter [Penicillium longicatenatum]|nr:ATPase P-type K/Mg/Cd/Cu/Zn/Na/Ca/Na/H-transporter [Penicillium longicatenatum]
MTQDADGSDALALNSHSGGDYGGVEAKNLHLITRFHTEDDLDILIKELEEEDGKDLGPEVLPIGPGTDIHILTKIPTTNPYTGLNDAEVEAGRRKHGWNTLKEERQSKVVKFLMLFIGPVQLVMEVAVGLSAYLQDWIDFGVISGLLLLNAVVGFIQEYQAGNIVDALKKTLALTATVIRKEKTVEVPVKDLVPGDVVFLEEGVVVPADGFIVSKDAHLQVDQSSISGESLAVDKRSNDPCFASSTIKRGEALMIVTDIGDMTFVGKAAALVNKAANRKGHFTVVLDGIAKILMTLVSFSLLLIWISAYYRSNEVRLILEFTLAITVVGVPIGLPAVVTTTMAVGASELARKSCIVQRLSAIESLAGVNILCSDKTGTLTRNKLALGDPFALPGIRIHELILTACLAASRKKKGLDAIDRVFIKSLRRYPDVKAQMDAHRTIDFKPFDPVSKRVIAVVQDFDGRQMTCVKGAPMSVLRTVQDDHPVPELIENAYREKVAEFASRGFRALGVARKTGEQWEILGIVPCLDPPRYDTKQTIREAQKLGLRIKMLTGDAVGIARETARSLGLGTNIYNAERLGVTGAGDLPGSEVNDFVEAADGFAEVFPEHKYKVVEILQQRGHLVAMTGDGVNDAPSLKKADTGIAVEGSSDAARSASDIVFLQPGLSAIIDAIKCSRQIFHRMYSYVIYRIALSLHLEFFMGLWIIIMDQTLDVRLVVLIAIFADIATLSIAYDHAPYAEDPVNWNLHRLWGISTILGIILAIGSWVALGTMLLHGDQAGIVQHYGARDAVLFLEIALTQNWLIFITRLNTNGPVTLWRNAPSTTLIVAVLAVDVAATLICHYGVFLHTQTSWMTIARVYIFSLGISMVCGTSYVTLKRSTRFDDLMHGRIFRRPHQQRENEDFDFILVLTEIAGLMLNRMAVEHEHSI